MAMMLPGWATQALQLVGYEWPSTNEDTLNRWGQEWSRLGGEASAHADGVAEAVAYVGRSNSGPATEAFTAYMNGDSNLAALRDFAAASQMLGQACVIGAGIVVTLKFAVIAQLATLAAAIIAAAASFGIGTAAVLAAREVARRLIQAAINLAVSQIMGA